MKKLFLISVLLWAFSSLTASAQFMDISLGRVWYEDERIKDVEAIAMFKNVDGFDLSNDYIQFRKGYKKGVALMAGGTVGMVLGPVMGVSGLLMLLTSESTNMTVRYAYAASMIAGGVISVGGVGCFIAGIPFLCINNERLKVLANRYNDYASDYPRCLELNFGLTSNGVGLALKF